MLKQQFLYPNQTIGPICRSIESTDSSDYVVFKHSLRGSDFFIILNRNAELTNAEREGLIKKVIYNNGKK